MKLYVFLTFISMNIVAVLSHKLFFESLASIENNSHNEVAHWVLLVAGSNEYYNYRHQADISHAYQIVKKHGIPPERIVTLMYDDIANHKSNPVRGQLFNRPGGPDVYKGVVVDYRGKDVTPENFLAVLRGDEKAVAGIGSGKVIKSGPNDHVFVNFVDHGAPGILGFPEDLLHAKDLIDTIMTMHTNKQYGQMVMYIEACESGSIFEGLLPEDINVYVTTAANGNESSYACYYDNHVQAYLGDVYSVNWMEDSDEENLNLETLHKQFLLVQNRTTSSTVCEFGEKKISGETIDNFQGETDLHVEKPPKTKKQRTFDDAVPSEDVPLATLYRKLDHVVDKAAQNEVKEKIKQLIWEKDFVEETSRKLVQRVSSMVNHRFSDLYSASYTLKSHDCYKEAVTLYKEYCFDVTKNGYALKSLRKLVNLCESKVPISVISTAIKNTCTYARPVEDSHFYI